MLSEEKVIDKIEILENGAIQIREATRITKDGQNVAEAYHRYCLAPGQDVSTQPANVQAVCAAVWTTESIASYKAALPLPPGQ